MRKRNWMQNMFQFSPQTCTTKEALESNPFYKDVASEDWPQMVEEIFSTRESKEKYE